MTHAELFAPLPSPALPEASVPFGVIGLSHNHIYGMCRGLKQYGGVPVCVYDPDPALAAEFCREFPGVTPCRSEDEVLTNPQLRLIVTAAIPVRRADILIRAMEAGKHVLADKAPVITAAQWEQVRAVQRRTGLRCAVYYSENVHNEAAVYAAALIRRGVIGQVYHVEGLAPHILRPEQRPPWFFRREDTGGILIDIGSQQAHQFLLYAGCAEAAVTAARAGNAFTPSHPDFDDHGDALLTAPTATGYFRIDWGSPAGIPSWGDTRTFIEGDRGCIELRKNCDIGGNAGGNHILVATDEGVFRETVTDRTPFPFFADLLTACLTGQFDPAVQAQEWEAIRLAIEAQHISGREIS